MKPNITHRPSENHVISAFSASLFFRKHLPRLFFTFMVLLSSFLWKNFLKAQVSAPPAVELPTGVDQDDSYINQSGWHWTVDHDANGPVNSFEGFRWWQNGAHKFTDLIAELNGSNPSNQRTFSVYSLANGTPLHPSFRSYNYDFDWSNRHKYRPVYGLGFYNSFGDYLGEMTGNVDHKTEGYDWGIGTGDDVQSATGNVQRRLIIAGRRGGIPRGHLSPDMSGLEPFVTVSSSGNLGVGIQYPSSVLHLGSIGSDDVEILKMERQDTSYLKMENTAVFKLGSFQHGIAARTKLSLLINDSTTQTYNFTRATTWLSNGYVGIGTDTPQATLHVNGKIKAQSIELDVPISTANSQLTSLKLISDVKATLTDNTDVEILRLERPDDPNVKWRNSAIFKLGSYGNQIASNTKLSLFANDGSNADDNAQMMTWTANQRVGIGTEDPEQRLHVKGGALQVERNGIKIVLNDNDRHYFGWIGTRSNHGLIIGTNNDGSNMLLDTSNNVFIGYGNNVYNDTSGKITIKPDLLNKFNLFVGEGILSENYAIAPNSEWADYVLDKNYTLRPLKEVEEFINKNKHLPNIPTAREVKEVGYDLHKQNILMLEKIEELTLYTIQQEKDISTLKALLSNLEAKIEKLEKSK